MSAAATADLRQMRSIHKRVWTAAADGYLDRAETPGFDGAACGGAPAADGERRRRYGIDPWGTSYWLSVQRIDRDHQRVVVYSFGPNRRRDGTAQEPADDDIGLQIGADGISVGSSCRCMEAAPASSLSSRSRLRRSSRSRCSRDRCTATRASTSSD